MNARVALVLKVDGMPGVWLSAPVARLYGDLMAATIKARVRRDPQVAEHIRDDVMVTQALLKLGSGTGTEVAVGNGNGTSSSVDPAALHLSVADVASLAGISDRGIRKAITSGRLRATRVGRSWVIDPVNLQQFLQSREAAA